MYKIIEKKEIGVLCTQMRVLAPLVAKKALPGQFVILRVDERGERIPLTIADYDRESGMVTIIFQQVGATTRRLGSLSVGDDILDFVGPLGRPSELSGVTRAIVVGGGVGCAIAWPQAKHMFQNGARVDVIAGFRSRDIVILEDEMRASATSLTITTDDGSYGTKGFVTEVLREMLMREHEGVLVIAIGPVPMMKAVCAVTQEFSVKTLVSLNPIMVDGTGMCGGCRVTVGGEMKFACVDGPDFDGHLVDFDELTRRNAVYRPIEAEAAGHACRLLEKGEPHA